MDIRVQAYTPPLPTTQSRAVAKAVPTPTVTALATLANTSRQTNAGNGTSSADRAKTAAAAAFNAAPTTQATNQPTARGGVAFTSPPEPGQLINILV